MKIGLRSVDGTFNTNFGSFLQCFALYSFLEQLFPNDEILYLNWWGKNQRFEKTIYEKETYGKCFKSINDYRDLDSCVIGSDCVMYFNETDLRELDDFFLLNTDVNKIWYSVGSQCEQNSIKQKYKDYLNQIECVSIRDIDNTKFIQNSIVNIDPTLLFDEQWWNQHIVKPNDIDEDFIKTKSISYCPWFMIDDSGWFKKPDDCIECYLNKHIKTPFEFLWVLKNCKQIYSYSFHAFIFSFIFNKTYINNGSYGFKVLNLMNFLNIKHENGVFINRDEVLNNIKYQKNISKLYLKYMINMQN